MKIAVLGANPAWQKTLAFEKFVPGRVNRANKLTEFASGKGINFCRASQICGVAEPVLLQFTGGENGRRLNAMLDSIGIAHYSVMTETPTRCCTTILSEHDQSTTECIEPSFAVSDKEISELISYAEKVIPECDISAVCGSLPGKTPLDVYAKFAGISHANSVPMLVDSVNGLDFMFDTKCSIHLKINKDELLQITGLQNVSDALKKLFTKHSNLVSAAITDGADKAFASDGKTLFSYTLPALKNIVSTLGCGDTASAVHASFLAAGHPVEQAFLKALAAASANCLTPTCGEYSPDAAGDIEKQILSTTLCPL